MWPHLIPYAPRTIWLTQHLSLSLSLWGTDTNRKCQEILQDYIVADADVNNVPQQYVAVKVPIVQAVLRGMLQWSDAQVCHTHRHRYSTSTSGRAIA
jgi:hypothetical protein